MMSSGVYVAHVWADLLSAGQIEVRAGLSNGHFLLLNRTDQDLAQMMKRLVDGFLDDRTTLSSNMLTGLLRVRAADQISDDQVKTLELNKLLQTIIKLPHKFSQSEAVRDFFKPSAVDQIFRKDQDQDRTSKQQTSHMFTCEHQEVDQSIPYEDQEVDQSIPYEDQDEGWSIRHEDQDEDQSIMHEDQDEDQSIMHEEQNLDMFLSPVISTLPDILRSNGFCLANTETILFDLTPPTQPVNQSEDSKGRRASVGPSVCLQLCHPSVSLMMGRLKGRSFRHAPPPSLPPSTCCTPGPRRCTSWSD